MRHFDHLSDVARDALFRHQPEHIPSDATASEVGSWLGATLYVPAGRPSVVDDLVRQRRKGVFAAVIDFEDSMTDSDAVHARMRAADLLTELATCEDELPFIFLRMRNADDMPALIALADGLPAQLAGFVFPKFDPTSNGAAAFEALAESSRLVGRRMLGMPILESAALAFVETRNDYLSATARMVASATASVACIRIGAADIAGIFGLRRSSGTTIYDIKVVSDVIADVVNTFVRPTSTTIPVSGPVWEHYSKGERILKPRLRTTPFVDHQATDIREGMVSTGLDALLAEIALDRLNGLSGKTVIHPAHVGLVHALSVVSHEEYEDALSIVAREDVGGALASPAGNKMNEVRPHMAWARSVLQRARIFGAARPEIDFVDFLIEADQVEGTPR